MDPNQDNATEFNQRAWDNIATSPSRWFTPVDAQQVERARKGDFQIRLTGTKPVPSTWIPQVAGKSILCLAAGGGHQGPILAAAGANVTVYDISEEQLNLDRKVAKQNNLSLKTIEGDVIDSGKQADSSFDLVVNPCSLNFVPNVLPVWRETFRVMRPGGRMMSGMIDPVNYLFDARAMAKGEFVVRHKIPYSDLDLPAEERAETLGPERPIDFGHTLTDLIAGQLKAGFLIEDFFQDRWGGGDPLSKMIDVFIATLSRKPAES